MIKIEITEEIATMWKEYLKDYFLYSKMKELGVFEKDNIQVTLYFDKFSSLRAVDKTKRLLVNNKKLAKVALQD